MPPKQSSVFVVYERDADGDITFAGAYTKKADANTEAKKLKDSGKTDVEVEEMSLDAVAGTKKEGSKGKATAASKKAKEKSATPADDDQTEDENAEADQAPAKPKAATKKTPTKAQEDAKAARKVPIEGEEGSCSGLNFLFTGTMDRDRPTMEATAIKHGGAIVKKLEETDWIILGKKPGDKKVEEIKAKGLKTMSEDQFVEMVKGGAEPTASAGPPKKKVKT